MTEKTPEAKTATQQEVFRLIREFGSKEKIIAIPRVFLHMFKSANTGVFLGQLLYWCDKSTCNKKGYFYKTGKEWTKETGLPDHAIRKARKQLVDAGLLETHVWRANGSPTVHFRLLKDNLVDAVLAYLAAEEQEAEEDQDSILPGQAVDLLPATNRIVASDESLTENTTEITTKNKTLPASGSISDSDIENSDSEIVPTPTIPVESSEVSEQPRVDAKPIRPPAADVYRERMHRWPRKTCWPDLERVGSDPEDLKLWGLIVKKWDLLGRNPTNLDGMLEHFDERKIPCVYKKGVTNARSRVKHEAATPGTVRAFADYHTNQRRTTGVEKGRPG